MKMYSRSILSIVICTLAIRQIFGDQRHLKSSVFQINNKKPIHALSDKFLSFTVDPASLLHVADCQITNATFSMVEGLLPAYLRVAGSDSNRFVFKSLYDGKFSSEFSSSSSALTSKSRNLILSGDQWRRFYELISSIGLNLIVCLNGGIFNERTDRDLSNALEFITFSNKNDYNMNWQLGYELQKISSDDGKMAGQDVAKLRKILEVFPRYQNSLIIGPDVTNFDSRENIIFLRNYLTQAQNSLNIFTIHPNFTAIPDEELYDVLSDLFLKMDTYLWIKDGIFKSSSKGVVPRKPIWISESEDKTSECKFSDSMSMIRRLGFAAKLGASVYLRKPHLLSFYEPTSEYWAASLFKALVGRSVLDMRLVSGNNSSVVAFSHCTQIMDKPEESIINPTVAYERGSVTVYGVNTELEPSRLIFKTGIKTDETMHIYVLTEDYKNRLGKTLLNRQYLGLSDENELPMLSPKIRESAEYVIVPPRSIFFLIFPNIRSRACMQQLSEDNQEATKIKIKPSLNDEEESTDVSDTSLHDVPETFEDPEDENAVYVSYPKKSERIKAARERLPKIREEEVDIKPLRLDQHMNPSFGAKYITFSDDTWLSSFPEKFKEIEQPVLDEVPMNIQAKKDKHSRIEKYRVLAQAIVGQRNVTPSQKEGGLDQKEDDSATNVDKIKRLLRNPRSVDSLFSTINNLNQKTRDSTRNYVALLYDQPISDDLGEPIKIPSHWYLDSRKRRHAEKEKGLLMPEENVGSPKYKMESLEKNITEVFDGNISAPVTEKNNISDISTSPTIGKMNSTSIPSELLAESDETTNVRQNREIYGKSGNSDINSALNLERGGETSNAPSTFGPVSPFSHHHKPIKSKAKSVKVKKVDKRINLFQNNSFDAASKEVPLPSWSNKNLEFNPQSITSSANKEMALEVERGTSRPNSKRATSDELENIQSPSNLSSPDARANEENSMQENSTPAKVELSTDSSARNADIIQLKESEIGSRNANKDKLIVSTSLPSSLHTSSHHKHRANIHSDHSVNENKAPVHPSPHIRAKQMRIKPTTPNPLNDFVKKLKADKNKLQSSPDTDQVINLAHARIQELLNIHKAKLAERQKQIQELAAARRAEGRNTNQVRNKREITDFASTSESKNSVSSRYDESTRNNLAVSTHQIRLTTHLPNHPYEISTTVPMKDSSIPRKEKLIGKQFQGRQKSVPAPRRHVITKSPLADKHKTKLRTHERRSGKHQLQKRDVLEDFCAKVKDVFEDVSTNVQTNIGPVEKWMEDRAEDVKKEINQMRDKRDLESLRRRLRERSERFRQKVQEKLRNHRIHVRDVTTHFRSLPKLVHDFDEKLKNNEERILSHHTINGKKIIKQNRDDEQILENKEENPKNFMQSVKDSRYVRFPSDNELSDEQNDIFIDDTKISNKPDFSTDLYDSFSTEKSESPVLENFSDVLAPPEEKPAPSANNQCEKSSNILFKLFCETMLLISKVL